MERGRKCVVIIGAGVAGLAAAARLRERGFDDVTVLEASEKIGGRVASAAIGDGRVDTGAQYIHGTSEKNPVFQLLKRSGLLSQVPDEGTEQFYSHARHQLPAELIRRVYDAGEEMIRVRGDDHSGRSLGERFSEKSAELLATLQSSQEKERMESVLALVGKDTLIDVGASGLHQISLHSWKFYLNMGDSLSVAGLMFQLVEMLLRDFPEERLLLQRNVEKIEWDGAFGDGETRRFPVRVVCESGEEFVADHVLVTVSLGCLKAQARSLFIPSLPEEKMDAINKLSFGNIAKIFLEYEEAFWENDVGSFSVIYDGESPASVSTDVSQWIRNVQSFTVLRPRERFGNVLVGWCPGDVADLVETMTEDELSSALTEHLQNIFGREIPKPKCVFSTKWRSNTLIRGSYTFLPVGVDAEIMDVLAQPLKGSCCPDQDLQVMFAGEATIKSLYGTVHGALISGQREADRLADRYHTQTL